MDVITIESKAYQDLLGKIERISDFVTRKEVSNENKDREIWLDSYEVANLLRVSLRTIQRLRSDKQINYSILRGRCLYKLSEIERMLNERLINCDPQTLDEFRSNYLLKNGSK